MRLTHKVTVRMPEIRALRRHAPQELQTALRKTLMTMEVTAKMAAPVNTGALRASIHMVLFGGSDREGANAMAQMLASRKGRALAIGAPRHVKSPFEGWLSTAVNYAPYQEQLRHYMRAAATVGERRLKREVQAAVERAKRGGQ